MNKNETIGEVQQFWADLAIEELIRCGIDYFCVAPGSRSTPLALAVANNPRAQHMVHFDERSLAFHALGYAAARRGGVAIITTSGTAVANILPAAVEASKKKLPLVIMSADRPVELRQTGANQTIQQTGIFGQYVRWECDLCVPTSTVNPAFVLTTIAQAVFRSRGELPGPVHLNWMFREPFALVAGNLKAQIKRCPGLLEWYRSGIPFTTYQAPVTSPSTSALDSVEAVIQKSNRGLIAVGKLPGTYAQRQVLRLAEKLQWPVLADITSGLRLDCQSETVISNFDHILPHVTGSPQLVLHLGGRMTSKKYYQWIARQTAHLYISVINHPLRNDPDHQVRQRVQCCPGVFSQKMAARIPQNKSTAFLYEFQRKDKVVEKIVGAQIEAQGILNEPGVSRMMSQLIPRSHALFLSNSMPIREMDMFAYAKGAAVPIGANRGASGIDGIVASAAGFATGLDRPVTLLIGDLAFMHDMNALNMLRSLTQPLIIVLVNNDGGGIFEFLPIAQNERCFETLFAAAHGLHFADVARQFAVAYHKPESAEEFQCVYRDALKKRTSAIIEVATDRAATQKFHKNLANKIKAALKQSGKRMR